MLFLTPFNTKFRRWNSFLCFPEFTGLVGVSHAANFYRVVGGVCLELLGTIDWTEYMVE